MGLLVLQANLAILDMINPIPQPKIRDSNRMVCVLSAYMEAANAMHAQATAKITMKSRLAGFWTLKARSPVKERR